MNTNEVTRALRTVREAKQSWNDARREFDHEAERITKRLIFEASANRMTVNEVARASGLTTAQVRTRMRRYGLVGQGKSLLAQTAADALRRNAELLGVEPSDIDLMSPLAYLDAGRDALNNTYSARSAEAESA